MFLYRTLFGFDLARNARIGMFNYLDVRKLTMRDHSHIRGFGNIFMSVHEVEMLEFARIGGPRVGLNLFRGTANKKDRPRATLRIGRCSIIELFHYFDICGDILLGDNVCIGGIRSVFFTHTISRDTYDPIVIGDNVYVATNCLFQMGTRIGARSMVGMGSVVVKPIDEEDVLIGGVPARILKENFGYSAEEAFRLRHKVYFRDGSFVQPEESPGS
jgi:acetyltransferase-like isoleucine patch superfamily enzyme